MVPPMTAEAPPFWWHERDWRTYLLYPASAIYGAIAGSRMDMADPPRMDIPILCVGNLTVGGAGKTPVAIALAKTARSMGFSPGFLSRGYGGGLGHPRLVNTDEDTSWHSGDEPLLLAKHAPTAVAANRKAGIELLMGEGCDFAVMDDGFQSARLKFDFALIVVDTLRGIGNGHVIPGGPLRAPLKVQLRHASAVVTMGTGDAAEIVIRRAAQAGKPLYSARTRVINPKRFSGSRYLAFAGIGYPEKFFDTVRALGGELVRTREYGDHHAYSSEDIHELTSIAESEGLQLITTEKDAVRFVNGNSAAVEFLSNLNVVKIEARFDPESVAERIVAETSENFKRNRYSS